MTAEPSAQLSALSDEQKRALLRTLLQRGRSPVDATGAQDGSDRGQPLSHGQRGLWFLQQLHPESAAYNMAWPARIESVLQVDALRRAFLAVMERHAALHTVVVRDGDRVAQHSPADWQHLLHFQQHDISGGTGWSDASVQEAVDAAYRTPFDLSHGPTVRVDLFTASADRHVLLVVVHHLFADAWSLQVLLRDLGVLYEAECAAGTGGTGGAGGTGAPAALPRLPWGIQDYTAWQRTLLDSAEGAALWQRWHDRLRGPLPVLDLPTDLPRPLRPSFRGNSSSFALDAELTSAIKQLARQEGCTVFVVLLSAFYVLLARYTRSRDLLVGTPMSGRKRDELADMVGYFVNLIPLRVQVSPEARFRELVADVRRTVLDAMDDQDMPFDALVERLQPERDASRSPLVETLFEYRQPHHDGELLWLTVSEDGPRRVDIGGLSQVGHYPLRQQEGKFDLQLEMADLPDGIAGIWKYRPDLLDADLIARMTRHLRALLRGAVRRPDARVGELPLMEDEERREVARLGQARAGVGAVRPIHVWFEDRVAEHPDAIAVIDGVDPLSYDELNRQANRIARGLLARGVAPGHRVGLCVGRSAGIVVGELAILKAGAAYVPLDPALPAERLAFYAGDAALDVVLTVSSLRDRLAGTQARLVLIDELLRGAPEGPEDPEDEDNDDNLGIPAQDDDPAYVIYTSGSTGRPKGVVVSHRNVARLFRVTEPAFGFGRDDVWTLFHSYAFDFSVWEIWGALLHGGRLVIVSSEAARSPELLHALLCSEGVTVLNQTPSAFQELDQVDALVSPAAKLALRFLIFGGEALAPGALQRWVERHGDRAPALVNMYGITETCVHVTFRRLSAQDIERPATSPIGRAIDDLSLHVLDDHMALVPVGVPGELYVGGDGVALGYLHRPGLTAERFVPDPLSSEPGRRLYRTGDLARYSPATGELAYLGRIDSQVKIRGFRIELGEIEHVFRAQPAVRDVVVLADRGTSGGDYLIAYVVPRRDQVASSDEALASALRGAVAGALPAYMVPAAVVMIDRLPLNHNGKIDRKALPSWTDEGRIAQAYEAPRTPVEQRLAAIWTELLPVERVGRADRFFHVGGHSLLATRLILRVRQEFAIELPILAIFESPTLADFAKQVEAAASAQTAQVDAPIARVDRGVAAPLGLAQQRLWFLDRLDAGNPVYNVPMLFRMTGALDRRALEHSIAAIAGRHEALRTWFPQVAGQPVQHIAPSARYELPVVDLRDHPADEREAKAQAIATAEYHRSFDLAHGPLWRAQLVIVDDTRHWLVMCAHHIVLDGWSVNLYLGELKELYRAFVAGTPPVLPELATQYVDFSEWQRTWLAGDKLAAQVQYWKDQLADAPAMLDVPGDRPRPPIQTFRGALLPFALSAQQSQRVREVGLAHQATPFMVLLGAFQALLYRYTGQTDLLVGSPIANRPRREVENLLGCFVNNLVLRGRFDEPQSFRELLQATRATTLGAYAHQDVPFEMLVDVLKPPRDLSRNPLFQVMFALQNTPTSAFAAQGLTIESVLPDSQIAKFDLSLSLVEDAAGFTGFFEYSSDLYDRATIEALSQAFSTLLDSALPDPEQLIDDLALLTPAQRHRLLVAWNPRDEAAPPPRTIAELFAAQVTARGDERCLVTANGALSYREVDARAQRLARTLADAGVGPEVPVGICMTRTADLPIAMLAVLLAGGACVPMDPKYPRDRLSFIARDAGLSVIVGDASARPLLEGYPGKALYVDELAGEDAASSAPDARLGHASVDHLAYIIYTSGSTGRPKGVALSHRGVNALLAWSQGVYADADLQGVLASTSICFDLSIFELFITWGRGGTVVLVEDLLDLPANPAAASVRLINTVPSAMTELLRMRAVPPGVRVVNLAGEPIRQSLVDGLYALGTVRDVYNLYGPTEDTVYSTFTRLPPSAAGVPPIGVAINHGRAYVLDSRMHPVPAGVTGELYLGGEGLARGYVGQPGLTALRFVPNPFGAPGSRLYKTGDLARWRNDGQLEFLGRNDGQVKLRGFRIELGEIEEALSRHPLVREAAVLVRGEGALGPRLVAYVATGEGVTCTASQLRHHLHETLPSYMVPAAYVLQATLPHTPNGKIDRRALPAPEAERPAPDPEIRAPANAIEAQVAAIWQDVLGLPSLGTDDNFFDLGGHSLLFTRVHVRIDEVYPGRVSLSELFQYPTVRTLAAFLADGAAGQGGEEAGEGEHGRARASLRRRQRESRRRPGGGEGSSR